MFARFNENPAMTLQDIKETKRYGQTDARTDGQTDRRTDGQRENSIPPTNKVCGGYNKNKRLKPINKRRASVNRGSADNIRVSKLPRFVIVVFPDHTDYFCSSGLKIFFNIFFTFFIGKNRHVIGKKDGYWGRNSAPQVWQIKPWKYQYSTKIASVRHLAQVNEGKAISLIYTICFYRGFGIHSLISLLITKTFNIFTNIEIV